MNSPSDAEMALWEYMTTLPTAKLPVRARGAGHRWLAQADAGTLLSLHEFGALKEYRPADLVVTVGAGMRLSQLNRHLAEAAQWMPAEACDGADDTLGGLVAAAVESPWRGGYGPLADRVLGIRVVTPAWGPAEFGAHVVKNVAGYNVLRLFLGTRGTLGIITEVTLKVSPRPLNEATWRWYGAWDAIARQAQQLEALATPWARVVVVRSQGERFSLYATWHGAGATIARLERQLNRSPDAGPVWELSENAVAVQGAVPRRLREALAQRPEFSGLVLEWQTGWYAGTVSEAALRPLSEWVHQEGGAIRVMSSTVTVPRLEVNPLGDVWRRLKLLYDPEGVLGTWE